MRATLLAFPLRLIDSFKPASMPPLTRASYRFELLSSFFFPFALACLERGVAPVIAKKTFDAPDLAIATLAAAPAMANITSFLWTRFIRGRDRVRAANLLQAAVLGCVAVAAIAPISALGVLILVVSVVAARCFMAGIITARSDIWRSNYPRSARARATGKFTIVTAFIVAAASLVMGAALDAAGDNSPTVFRILFLAAAAIGAAGVWAFSRVRWRGRAAALAEERRAPAPGDHDPSTPRGMLRILKTDVTYRRFMIAQFVLGIANLAADAPFVIALTRELNLGYAHSIALTQAVPFVIPVLTIPLWARFLDRVHIVRFRVYHSWFFVGANLLMCAGLFTHSLPILYLSRAVLGVAYGGGMLAWELGHHDFAPRNMATIYMGIHATLTGVRGAIAPFIGTALYAGFALHLGDTALSWRGMGPASFLVFAATSVAGALLFLRLHRTINSARP